ncbi:hypothetical protein BDV12DRAFT_200692 [Aspergillus spectabilis]
MGTSRYRRFSAKVRTGCKTCKTRRVKCDETQPSCLRCTSSGRICDGYIPAQSLLQQPRVSSQAPDAEQRALHTFYTVIAPSIVSAFDVDFWTYDLLQAAKEFKTVQFAVAALAAAYESCILSTTSSFAQRQFVLTQYTKSINSLRQYLGKTKFRSKTQQSVALITNYLLTFLCAIQGFHTEACAHLRSGLSLIHEWGLGTVEERTKSQKTPTVLNFLVASYTQLDTQARMKIEAIGAQTCAPWSSHHVSLDGWGSGNIEQITRAFIQLEGLHNRAIQRTVNLCPLSRQHPPDLSIITEYQHQLSLWDSMFAASLGTGTSPTSSSIRTLQMRRLLAQASWERPTLPAYSYQSHDETCREIVHLATQIIQESGLQGRGKSFNPTGALIETLYYVATRCLDDDVRWQAIDLLEKNVIVEGLWESTSAAKMAVAAVYRGGIRPEDVDY